ncbi:MAG: response regulator [candidate division NC10 bacterium]|nr:response regulator [candidate division NC10 bacterium]
MPELLLSKGRVLVVDEERLVRQQLSKLIAGCGFKVEVAASAEAARKKVEGNPYDAVFLDLMLRRVGGVELLPQILRLRPDLSVVVMAGDGSLETSINAVKRGALYYLIKPVEQGVLDGVLRNCMERSRLLKQMAQLKQTTLQDDLTTAFNRRHLDAYL